LTYLPPQYHNTALIAKNNIKELAISFAPVPIRKARKAAQAILNALFPLALLKINSPRKAPIKGPTIIPSGGKMKIPANRPKMDPIEAALEPPNFFTSFEGRK